jgi:ABC-type multidrug transport system ATPase subunit
MALVNIENVARRVNGQWVLWDVTLGIGSGETIAIFGRAESGKSSLARVIAGLDQPTQGRITTGEQAPYEDFSESDEESNPQSLPAAAPKLVSVALSTPAAARDLTVFENLELNAALWGVPKRKRTKSISVLLELLGLTHLRTSVCSQLSLGALKRFEIARAMVADAPVLLIDSLLDSLDRPIMEKLWDHFLTLRREESKSVVILTSRGKIADMCNRLAVMHKGKIIYLGRAEDFRRAAGDDMVVLGDIADQSVRNRIQDKLSVVIREEDGFLSFRVSNGEKVIGDLLSDFGSEMSCVYLKRPTIDDALDAIISGQSAFASGERTNS